jgi:hypothetical protein
MKNAVSLLLCWLAVLVCDPAGQQLPPAQPPTFRTGVDAVQLDVSVLDRQRRPVRGLTASDHGSRRRQATRDRRVLGG